MDLWPCLYLYIQHYNTFRSYDDNENIAAEKNEENDEYEE